MNVYKELERIAEMNCSIKKTAKRFAEKRDIEGLDFSRAFLIEGCKAEGETLYDAAGERLNNCGLVDDDYFCNQHTGYCEDDYYGTLYFATKEPGKYIGIPFQM